MLSVRRLQKEDIAGICALEQGCFSHPWSENAVAEHMVSANNAFYGAFSGGELASYGGVCTAAGEGYITNICTDSRFRRMGAADAVLTAIERFCREQGCEFVSLEVRRSNLAAVSLYQKHGFSLCGVRKGFYSAPEEDAMIYTKYF